MNEKIHAHLRKEAGYDFEITIDELPGVKLHMDEPRPLGTAKGPSAAMVLSSAVGHCLTSSLQFCLEKSRAKVKDISTDVETSLVRNERGRWRIGGIKVNLNISVDDSDKEKLQRCKALFEDFCIVTASVKEGIKVDVELKEE